MSSQLEELECSQSSEKRLLISAGLLIGVPLVFAVYFFWRLGAESAADAKLFFVVLFSVVWFPAVFWLAPDYVSRFRFDRAGVHRSGIPLRGGKIRWSEMDEISIEYGHKVSVISIHGAGRRFVLTSRTHENVDAAADRLRTEAERRGIPLE